MRYLWRYKTTFLLPALAVAAAFWIVAPWLDRNYVFAITSALAFSIGVGVVLAYLPDMWTAMRSPRKEMSGGHILVMGIVLAWASSAERGAFSYVYRFLGQPEYMQSMLIQAFAVWCLFWAGVLHLTAKDAVHGYIPRRNWVRVGVAVAVAISIAAMAVILIEPLEAGAGTINPFVGLPYPFQQPEPASVWVTGTAAW